MPGFPLIQGFTEARLARGLDAKEVKEIKDFVLAGRAAPNDVQSEQLLRLTVLYADYFTPAAKGAWEKLTGIPVDKAEAHYRQHAKLYKNVLDARLDLSAEKTRIQHDHAATPSGRGVAVDSRFLAEDLAARTKTEPTPSEITHRDAVALELPPATYRRVLAGGGAVIDRLMQALADQEKHSGDGDGVLTPRDCKVAPRELAAVADALFTNLGPRALHLQRDVRPALGAAICDLVFSGPRNEARHSGVGKDLFVAASRDVLDALAREYQTQVVRGGEPFTLFLEKNGVRAPAHKTAVLKALEALVPPPTLKETAHLYALAASEKLSSNDFYTAARLEQRDVFQLQAEHPGHFPRAPGQKDTSALPARKVLGDLAESSLTDHHQVAQAWAAEVVTGQKSVEQFTIDHGLRSNVLMRMRKDHPTLFAAPPRNTGAHDASFARDLAAAFAAAAAKDPFAKVPELVAMMNKDPAFTAAHGALTYGRYYAVRKEHPQLFGRADDNSRWTEPVGKAVRALVEAHPDMSRKELVERLQQTWPQMTYSRLSHLKDADPSIPLPGERGARLTPAEIDDLAARIQAHLAADPNMTHVAIAKELSRALKSDISAPLVSAIVRDYRPHVFSGIGAVDERRMQPRRQSVSSQAMLQLAIRACPPGTATEKILDVFNGLLKDKGITGFDAQILPRLTELQEKKGLRGPSAVHAKVTSEIFAEYARTAKKGASEDDVIAAIQKDWPTLDGRSLGRYRGMWRAQPNDYPAVAAFKHCKDFSFVGRGEQHVVRYRGGFDVVRQLEGAPPAEQAEWAKLTEHAAISLRLSEVDDVINDLNGSQPLANANVLWVSHLLGDIPPMAFALRDAGLQYNRTIVVGTPYGTNLSVKACLEDQGFEVRKPALDVDDYKKLVKGAIDDLIKKHKDNGEPICVLDDGGLVSDILHSDQKYAPFRKFFRIVEQTTGGLLLVEKHKLESVVVNVARSESKALEGEAIGEVVAAKIVQALGRFGSGLKGKETVLVGYGVVGPHVGAEIAARGGLVTIIERNPTRAAAAKKAGFRVIIDDPNDKASQAARAAALKSADLVVGATGRRTISLDDMKLLKDGAAIASASSKRIELAMEELTIASSERDELPSGEPLVSLPTARYRLGKKDLFVVGDGFPVNFDGGVQSVPPEKIQLTDAAMLAALFQASRIGSNQRGIVELDHATDQKLLARHRAHRAALTSKPVVYDPAAWRDVVKDIAERFKD